MDDAMVLYRYSPCICFRDAKLLIILHGFTFARKTVISTYPAELAVSTIEAVVECDAVKTYVVKSKY
jgi:hypothetical protein